MRIQTGHIFDYSRYVEVVGREADAVAYPYYPSDLDIEHTGTRLSRKLDDYWKRVPPSWFPFFPKTDQNRDLAEFVENRVDLFNMLECGANANGAWVPNCPVCGIPTKVVLDVRAPGRIPHIVVDACQHCGWWQSENTAIVTSGKGVSYDSYTLYRRAILREFKIFDDYAPLDACVRPSSAALRC